MASIAFAIAAVSLPAFALTVSGTPPQGTVGLAYSYTFTASGGVAPYSFSTSGLPPGLMLSVTGVVSGTPTTPVQNLPVSIGVTDSTGAKASEVVLFQIGSVPASTSLAIVNTPLPVGVVGIAYSQTLTATGGTLPYTSWMLVSGALPQGLSLSITQGTGPLAAAISGTPVTPGSSTFTVQVTDIAGHVSAQMFTLTISNFIITSGGPGVPDTSGTIYYPLTSGAAGVAYSQTIAATGGTPPYSFSVIGGSLPPGLNLSASGILSGTPTVASTYQFTLQARDGAALTTQKSFSLTIAPPGPQLGGASLANATVGASYSQSLTPTGGTPPYIFSITSGALPAGLSLSPSGVISGTPTAPAFNASFTVQVSDSAGVRTSQPLTLTVQPALLTITTAAVLPPAAISAVYSQNLSASGGIPPYRFGVISGTLPPGLTGSSLSSGGVLSGTPTTAGTFTFTIGVLDTPGTTGFGIHSADKTFTLVVTATPLTIGTPSPLPAGLTGTRYSQALAASGGTAPYTFALASGTVPAGLMLASTGIISGTPSTAGTFNFTAQVTDSQTQTASKAFSITIGSSLTISTSSPLTGATAGTAYSQAFVASGGAAPYAFSITSGLLPGGLTLGGTGVLSGTPVAPGNFNFTVQVADSAMSAVTKNFSLSVNPQALTLSNDSSLPTGSVALPYSQTIIAAGGTPPYTFALTGCCLPNGLGLSSGGVLSGSPTPAGTYNFTFSVTDSASVTVTKSYSLVINPSPITVSTPVLLPTATVGVAYSQVFAASGGIGTGLTFTASSGSPPPGLSFDAKSLSGIPTTAGSYSFTLAFSDSGSTPVSKTFTLVVNPAGLAIATGAVLPGGTVGIPYSQAIAATAGSPPYTFAIISGALPTGLTLAQDGTLAGTPTAAGLFTVGVQVTDSAAKTATQTLSIAITASPLTITAAPLAAGRVGSSYSQALVAGGGTPPYTFTTISGTLPFGLTLTSTGVLTGTPTTPGSFGFTAQVSDSVGAVNAQSFSVAIAPAGLTIATPSPLPPAAVGSAYTQTLLVAAGSLPYAFSVVSGSLPPGLALSSAGILSGTPTTAGVFPFTIQVVDGNAQSAAMAYSLVVTGTALSISIASPLPSGVVGVAYSQAVTASGGTPPYTYAITSGSVPLGLSLSSAGFLAGTPSTAGSFNFTVQATDTAGTSASKPLAVLIAASGSLVLSTAALPNGSTGAPYGQSLTVAGGTAPYRFALISGALPAGLTLNSSGGLAGVPTVAGTSTFTIQVTDAAGLMAAQAYTITIGGSSLTISNSGSLPGGTIGSNYTQTFTATGGAAPYSFTVVSGTLPPGLSLTSLGVLIGSPTTAGNFSFAVQVADSSGAKATAAISLAISAVNTPSILAVVNAASYLPGGLSPGEIVTLFGTGLGPASLVTLQSSIFGLLDTSIARTRVLFNNVPGALIYVSDKQTSAVVPYGTDGAGSVQIVVEYQGVQSPPLTFTTVNSAPGLFSANATGQGQGAILNQDFSVNNLSNPAAAGSIVQIYATGEGATDPAGVDGKITGDVLPRPKLPVMVTIGGLPADVLYAGGAPGIVAGGLQINARVPVGLPPGTAAQLIVTIGSRSCQAGITVAIQ